MSKQYKTILVPVDGSDASLKALDRAIELAKFYTSKLVIAHVIDVRSYSLAIAYREPLEEYAEDNAKKILADAEQKAKDAGITDVATLKKEGSPRSVIAKKIAPEVNADLIVMGATGYGMVERMFVGSVSESTVRHSTCDIMIVR
ncbi:universal stress protein [Ignatzschineria cameli]|uniref:Universal stress protein n=2 Tax=Bacteria TaxID=2 RepID=A0A2U2AU21_9GAMM|nr:universal stress protein [Ignatzschineria cameli]PWD87337.1 universal stress protein UspA [Ignatzschineria cameli]PWD88175.1 universal stress protein UspA [Ignatzschineria cameli]PWD91205.1 universal stress protein UspA [Ignatzschineria cameli]PWD92846.1 universal stress protein UspA [Ignatzschineria cameli]PWD93867.1 universal stress protein UspA [Ignatzschineria cameli]